MESSSPAYAAPPLLCSPVKRSALNVKLSFMIDAALFPALETLLAVARTGSVGAAARQRHITSSAVSQQIRKIESHFGIRLFERAGRGVRLVASGDGDLAVVTGQETPRGLEDRHLFDQPFAWVGPRRKRGDRMPLTERLRREPILRLAAESRGRAVLEQYLADARVRPV